MKIIVGLLIALCLAFSIVACTSTPIKEFKKHAVVINGEGNILIPRATNNNANSQQTKDSRFDILECPSGTDSERCAFDIYIEALFEAVESRSDKCPIQSKDVIIFVHGGLNNLNNSTDRANKLINKYMRGGTCPYYPILINWDSGFFESYAEHLFAIRQGETNKLVAIPTSPLYFATDVGRGLIRAPIDILSTTYHDAQTIPLVQSTTNNFRSNAKIIHSKLKEQLPDNVSHGNKLEWGLQTFYKVPINIITWLPQLALSPIVDAFGKPAWDNMQRRTKVLYNNPKEFDIEKDKNIAERAIRGLPKSVMDVFAKQLMQYTKKHQDTNITLVGHSMGSFIINDLLKKHPEITNIRNIIYMAGADSVRNTFNSIMPYLERNKDTKFYNLTLHPQNEVEESNYYLLPRGSLLVWIDDFYSIPYTIFDRTVGRWENVIQSYGEIPKGVRHQVYIKAFDQTSAITRHGDFGRALFWDERFWKPGRDDHDPWPEDGFYYCDSWFCKSSN
ncbi:MAG: hypothetical protein CSYNP_02122 [Syntrophus sp. SKADARSKE-3]|nr:hypothetical protein [Syntrophus sp. SKADARSKE-3]